MTDVEVVLADAKKEVKEKGYIQDDILVWGMRKMTPFNREVKMLFFGSKDGKFMVLPFIDIKTILYDQVKYYTKDEVDIRITKLRSDLCDVTIKGSKTETYMIMGMSGQAGMRSIVKMLYG